MHIFNRFTRLSLAWAISLALGSSLSAPAEANQLTGIRSSYGSGRMRVVLDLSQAPSALRSDAPGEVTCAITSQLNPPGLVLNLEGIRTQGSLNADRLPAPPKGAPVKGWSLRYPHMRSARLVLNTRYAMPVERTQVSVLSNPPRLVLDIADSWNRQENYQVTPGVSWQRSENYAPERGYLLWNSLSCQSSDPNVTVDVISAPKGWSSTAPLTQIYAAVQNQGALGCINGGFFAPSGGPLGLVARQGKIISPHVSRRPPRSVFVLNKDKQASVDRLLVKDKKILTLQGREVPLDNMEWALGAGPQLLHEGQIKLTTDEEQLGPKGNDITRACGRTAVASGRDGQLILATLSGAASNHAQGIKLPAWAKYLQSLGARQALNLDGGGSTEMVIAGHMVSRGPEASAYERPLNNALVVKDSRPSQLPETITLAQPLSQKIIADGHTRLSMVFSLKDKNGNPVPDNTPVYAVLHNCRLALAETEAMRTMDAALSPSAYSKNGQVELKVIPLCPAGKAEVSLRSGYASQTVSFVSRPDKLKALTAECTYVGPLIVDASPQPQPQASPAPTEKKDSDDARTFTPVPVPKTEVTSAYDPPAQAVILEQDASQPDESITADDTDDSLPPPTPQILNLLKDPSAENQVDPSSTVNEAVRLVKVTVLARDKFGNPLPDTTLTLKAEGTKKAVSRQCTTGSNGEVQLELHIPSDTKSLKFTGQDSVSCRLRFPN